MRNFVYKDEFPQVAEDGLGGVGNTLMQGAGNSVYSTDIFVIICELFLCLISTVETCTKRRKLIWERAAFSSTERCFEVLARIKPLILAATTQLYVRRNFDFSLFQ